MAKICCGRTQPWSCLDPGEAPGKTSELSKPDFQVIDAGIHFWNHSLDMCFRMLCGDSVDLCLTTKIGVTKVCVSTLRFFRTNKPAQVLT